jgi:iron complex transport system substrate-binding protein
MKPALILTVSISCLWFVMACGGDQSRRDLVTQAPTIAQTYVDQTGRSIALAKRPDRVISLAPSITEVIFAIGAADKLVGRTEACDYPPEAASLPAMEVYPSVDLEQIKAQQPELLLATDEIFSTDDIAVMEQLGLPIYLQHFDSLADVYRGIRELGRILRVSDRADHLADSLQALEGRIRDSTVNQVTYRTMILISNDPLMVAGGGGYLHRMIEAAGGKNVFGEVEQAYFNTTAEQILQMQPEVIILPARRQSVYAELLAQYPPLYNTPADVNKQVHVMDPDLLYRPGPRLLQGLLLLTNILHAKLTPSTFLLAE